MLNKIVVDANYLISYFEKKIDFDKNIVVPTPALTEFLLGFSILESRIKIFNHIKENFIIKDFDTNSALECANLLNNFDKAQKTESWQKTKFDFQIIAIAKANNINTIYTNDKQVKKIAELNGINAKFY
ncbi:MAG: hypothetical protein Ta2D_13370 [Rickettsiales bacterium]|nr:MAG: hypothetical protein Ta2D_13370 [Rickettsiales bacterium]